MTEKDWPPAVRDILALHPGADIVTKEFPKGFPHEGPFVAVAGLVRRASGEVLLVRHRPGTPWRDAWASPGGLVRGGEAPEEAVRREVREECGLELSRLTLGRVVVMEDRSHGHPTRSFTLIFEAEGEGRPRPRRGDRVAEAKWFSSLPLDMHFREEYADLV